MEEKTLFALRAPEIGEAADETKTVVSDGGELPIKIRSRKQKIANGHVVIETTTPSCEVTMDESWLSSRVEVDNQYNILDVYFNIEKNTSSSERTSVITVTQDESEKKLIIHIIQEAGVTYTDYLEVPLNVRVLGNTKGSTLTIKVISYSLGSDGSKVAKSPSVESAPSWANQVSVGQMTGDHEYPITFTATETNSSNTTREETAIITCGTARKSISISQSGQPIKKEFTLTGLPLDKPCYLFASGSRPQSGGSSTSYLMIHGLGGKVTMGIPVTVNLSSYGGTTTADTGDRVTVWTYSGSTFSQMGSFTVPSAGGTVSIKKIKITNNIAIEVYKSSHSEISGNCVIRADQPVTTDIIFKLHIQYGVSPNDQREYTYTLLQGNTLIEDSFPIQREANPRLVDYSYAPQSDSQYIYAVTVI